MADVLDQIAEALLPRMEQMKGRQYATTFKHDLTGVPAGNNLTHGPQGLLTFPGVDPVVFNATMGSYSILSQIPAVGTVETNPTYWTLTGVTDESGAEVDGVCDDAPIAGLMKACLTTSVFGRYERATPVLDVGTLGERTDRADPLDLRLVGSPIAQMGPWAGPANPTVPGDVFTNEVSRKFWEKGVALHRLLSRQLWTGNPANNSGAGGYKELTGLELLVNTGYVDAETGNACPRVDSVILDTDYIRVDSAEGASTLVNYITSVYYELKARAERSGVAPVRWTIAMRNQLFNEITAVWPCSYLTFRCVNATESTPLNMDARDAVRFRDEMRAGKYLLIDGDRVDVLVDDGIPRLDGSNSGGNFPAGCMSSDIYFLPMSMVGGQSTLFMEYFQFSNPSIQDAFGNMVLGRINGAWLTWPRQTNMCVQWQSRIQPRLVLRTPWLAARIENVVYCPTIPEPDPFPGDPYLLNGGRTNRPGPSFHNIWES